MIPGGIADKLGNRYEAKWLVLKLIEVVRGSASSVCFEGTAAAFSGFEFVLVKGITRQWHQVKISNTSGNWTISRLQDAKVLESFRKRLALGDISDECHFISQDPAVSLRDLTERARIATECSDLRLSDKLAGDFAEMCEAWTVTKEVAFSWLRRIYCRVQPESGLEESIEAFGSLCFSHASSLVFGALRDYLETRFNRELTTELTRIELPKSGLPLAHWDLDQTLAERLHSSTEDYLVSYAPVANEHLVMRVEAEQVLDELMKPDGASVILVTGGAGTGKSGVLHQVILSLQKQAIVHVALRADEFLDVVNRDDIGCRLTDRKESPVVTLKGMSGANASVLLIDQVDAVSEVAGRSTRLKSVLLRMLSDAEAFETVKVVCACRAFDLENDPRLKALTAQQSVRRIEVSQLDWETEVCAVLERQGINTNALSDGERKLLQLPLNLGIFLEVYTEGHAFRSRNELFRALLEKKARVVGRDRAPGWMLTEPLDALVQWMSERQSLQAPLAALRKFTSASSILSSEGLITLRGDKVHLFHESFFDFLFASRFVTSSRTLVETLLSDEDQFLFRRTQVRQILESLRQDDFRRYIRELGGLLECNQVRYHVKLAVVQWLSAIVSPSKEELDVVLSIGGLPERMPALVRWALFGTPGWFDVAEATSALISKELNSPFEARREDVLWWLTKVAVPRADAVGRMLDRWYRDDPVARGARLLDWFPLLRGRAITGRLLNLCKDVAKEQAHLLLGKRNSYRTSALLETFAFDDAHQIASIVKTYFDAWFMAHPSGHPFSRSADELDMEPLQKLADVAPKDFLVATTPALLTTIRRIIDEDGPERLVGTFRWRKIGEQFNPDDKFLASYRSALKAVAVTEPDVAEHLLSRLTPSLHSAFLHLHLETIASNGADLAHRLPQLLNERELFEAGWSDAPHQSFADAARTALPYLGVNERAMIEHVILEYRPELSFSREMIAAIKREGEDGLYRSRANALSGLSESGRVEWSVWETIGQENLSRDAHLRLAELRRKFIGRVVRRPQPIQAGFVGSPIPQSAVSKMSDSNWLQAITEYAHKDRRPLEGGAQQLSATLLQLTKDNPARFANLLPKIPSNTGEPYIRHILIGLGEADISGVEGLVVAAINSVNRREALNFSSEISHVICKHPALGSDTAVFEALCWSVEFGLQPSTEGLNCVEEEGVVEFSIEQALSRGDNIYSRALNGQRGSAADAFAHVLWVSKERNERAWQLIRRRIAGEQEVSVRCVLAHSLLPLYNEDRVASAELLAELASQGEHSPGGNNLLVLATRVGARLLTYVARQVPALGRRMIASLLQSEDEELRAIGAWQIIFASFYDDSYVVEADSLIAESIRFKLLAAGCAADAIVDGELTDRALALMPIFFDDNNMEIRAKAGEVFRSIPPESFDRALSLCRQYLVRPE